MSNKIPKMLGVGLAIVLAFALGVGALPLNQPPQAEASPGLLYWDMVGTPSTFNNVIAPKTDLYDMAVAPDGDTIYVVGTEALCVKLNTSGDGEAVWSTHYPLSECYSAKLTIPEFYSSADAARVAVILPTPTLLSSITSLGYWFKPDPDAETGMYEGFIKGEPCESPTGSVICGYATYNTYAAPYLTIALDTTQPFDGAADTWVIQTEWAAKTTGWQQDTISATETFHTPSIVANYTAPFPIGTDWGTLAEVKAATGPTGGVATLGDAMVLEVKVSIGEWNPASPCTPTGPVESYVDLVSPYLWKSTDGGETWTDITAAVQAAANLPGPFIDFFYGGVAVAPDDGDWVAVAGTICDPDHGPRPAVVASKDGATNFVYAGHVVDIPNNTKMAEIYDVAIAPEMDGVHNIAVAGINGAGNGTVYRLEAGVWLTGAWVDTSFYDDWAAMAGIIAVAFSPNFDIDGSILCLGVADATHLPYLQSGVWEIGGFWNVPAEFPPAVEISDEGEQLWTGVGIRSMGLALPEDYDGTDPFARTSFVYVDALHKGTGKVGGYLFRIDGDLVSPRCGPRNDPLLASIAFNGDATTGKAMVGTYIGWKQATDLTPSDPIEFTCCKGVQVYHTVELDVCCPTWYAAFKPPSGPYMAVVEYTPDGEKAYATTSGMVDCDRVHMDLWGGLCDESAFSVSLDDGTSWNQYGLIDTDIDFISDVAVSPDCETAYISTINNIEACQVCQCDSVWRSQIDDHATIGAAWQRVWHGDCSNNPLLLRLAPDEEDGTTVYLGDQGTNNMYYSLDFGQIWGKTTATRIAIQDFALESEKIVYVLNAAGKVSKSTNYGRRPSLAVNTLIGTGHTIAVLAEDNVLVGGAAGGKVAYSDDGAATFSRTQPLPIVGKVHVAFDTFFADNDVIYAAVGETTATGGIYRWVIGQAGPTWAPLNAEPYDYYGIVLANEGTLYAPYVIPEAESIAEAGVARCLTPSEPLCCGAEDWDYIKGGLAAGVALTSEPSALRLCGCLTAETNSFLWAIDNSAYDMTLGAVGTVWQYEDCVAKAGPTLKTPIPEAKIAADPCKCNNAPFALSWERLCLACEYDVQIAADPDFTMLVPLACAENYLPGDPENPVYPVGKVLSCAATFYWRVRSADSEFGAEKVHSPWSEVRSFTVEIGPFGGISLLAPIQGATDVAVTNVGFTWSSVIGATGYRFLLSPRSDLTLPLVTTTALGTGYTFTGTLDNSTPYFWRAIAMKDDTMISVSATSTFTTVAVEVPPPPPVVIEPTPPAPIVPAPILEFPPTPTWVYAIIGIGAALAIVVIVLIVRTRRPPA